MPERFDDWPAVHISLTAEGTQAWLALPIESGVLRTEFRAEAAGATPCSTWVDTNAPDGGRSAFLGCLQRWLTSLPSPFCGVVQVAVFPGGGRMGVTVLLERDVEVGVSSRMRAERDDAARLERELLLRAREQERNMLAMQRVAADVVLASAAVIRAQAHANRPPSPSTEDMRPRETRLEKFVQELLRSVAASPTGGGASPAEKPDLSDGRDIDAEGAQDASADANDAPSDPDTGNFDGIDDGTPPERAPSAPRTRVVFDSWSPTSFVEIDDAYETGGDEYPSEFDPIGKVVEAPAPEPRGCGGGAESGIGCTAATAGEWRGERSERHAGEHSGKPGESGSVYPPRPPRSFQSSPGKWTLGGRRSTEPPSQAGREPSPGVLDSGAPKSGPNVRK